MSNLPDSGGGIFPISHSPGGWDLSNAPPLLIQIAERMDTQARAHYALQQEVIALRHELRELDKQFATAQNNQSQIRDSVSRLGGRIGSVEAEIAALKADLEVSRRGLEESGYTIRTLSEKFAALDRRDDQQARELKAMREWQLQAIAVGGVAIFLFTTLGPKLLSALVNGG